LTNRFVFNKRHDVSRIIKKRKELSNKQKELPAVHKKGSWLIKKMDFLAV